MNPAGPLETEDKVGEGKIYDEIFAELEEIEGVSHIHRVAKHIYISYSGSVLPKVNSAVESIFDKENRRDMFEWTILDKNFELYTSDASRRELEGKVKNRVDELVGNNPISSKITRVAIRWTSWTKICRSLLGVNKTEQFIKVNIKNGTIDDYSVLRILQQRLEHEYGLQVTFIYD